MHPDECIVEQVLDVIATKWTPVIVLQLRDGTRRYNEIRRGLPGISPRVLTERLRMLEDLEVLERVVFPEVPLRVEYTLTDHGRRFALILDDIADWCGEGSPGPVAALAARRVAPLTTTG